MRDKKILPQPVPIENYTEETIFQYCSLNTFEKIITNKELWLTDAAFMNDAAEGKWLDVFLRPYLLEQEQRLWQKQAGTFVDGLLNSITLHTKPVVYLSCFSRDGDVLSQWRGYANDGQGVSLGFKFRSSVFYCPASFNDFETNIQVPFVQPVIYDEAWQQWVVEAVMNVAKHQTKWGGAGRLYHNASIFCKNPAFSEEKEVRLIYVPDPAKSPVKDPSPLIGPLARVTSNCLAPYYKLPIDGQSVELSEIIIGPKNKSRCVDIVNFLYLSGFPNWHRAEVKNSSATYR